MIVIPERSVDWVTRWTAHALPLGKHDGSGNLLLEHEEGDAVAADMVAEIRSDRELADGVAAILILIFARQAEEEGRGV